MKLVLASKSPRRRELIKLLGYPVTCITSAIEENNIPGESPADHVTRLSKLKAADVGKSVSDCIVIGSDTIVVIDGDILEKPESRADAIETIMRLQGRTHKVYSGFALFNTENGEMFSNFEISEVTMRTISREIAVSYIDTKEPFDKAGSYGIQGYGAVLITSIHGCFFNIMGLPLSKLMESLNTFSHGRFGYFGKMGVHHS